MDDIKNAFQENENSGPLTSCVDKTIPLEEENYKCKRHN